MSRYENVTVRAETAKAICCRFEGDDTDHWIPKSVIDDESEVWKEGTSGALIVADWFDEKLTSTSRRKEDRGATDSIAVSSKQRVNVQCAIDLARAKAREKGLNGVTDGRCLEMICLFFMREMKVRDELRDEVKPQEEACNGNETTEAASEEAE